MPFLLANNGPEASRRYDLEDSIYVLGRHPDCEIVIDVGAVSRRHCQVSVDGAHCFVEDLKSRNGTFLNERQIEGRQPLNHRDQLRVCDVVFTFQTEEDNVAEIEDDSFDDDIDDPSNVGSATVMSKLDVVRSRGHAQISASPEAKLNALMEITQSLGGALTLDEVFPRVLDSLFRIFHQADRGVIGWTNNEGVLIPKWTKLRRENSDETIRISRTIAKQVMDSKEAILTAEAASDSRFQMSESIAEFRIRSMMCAPLLDSDSNTVGMLQLDTVDQRQRFQEDDLELLVTVAYRASIAINNARMHETRLKQRTADRDLSVARDAVDAFLPDARPRITGYDFFDYHRASQHIAGDSYDYIGLPDRRLAMFVIDVVGHGIAAAALMAKLVTEARCCLVSEPHADSAVAMLNDRICNLNLDCFITFVVAVLDPSSHRVSFVNAGHVPPLIRRADGLVREPIRNAGMPLGIRENAQIQETCVPLEPGDTVLLYTNGLSHAIGAHGEIYGINRIKQVLTNGCSPTESQLHKEIAPQNTSFSSTSVVADRSQRQILIADSVTVRRIVLQSLITGRGYEITAVVDGQQAVNAAKSKCYDLALLQLQLPELTAFEAAEAIRRCGCPVIVGITSDQNTDELAADCHKAGMDGCISCPRPIEETWGAIERILTETTGSWNIVSEEKKVRPIAGAFQAKPRQHLPRDIDRLADLQSDNLAKKAAPHEYTSSFSTRSNLRTTLQRIRETLRKSDVHCDGAGTDEVQESLRGRDSIAHEILSEGFFRIVVLDAALALNANGEFELTTFQRQMLREMAEQFGHSTDDDLFHPAEIAQHLRDEASCLFCFLNVQHLLSEDFRTLRGLGFMQTHHRVLYCGSNPYWKNRRFPTFHSGARSKQVQTVVPDQAPTAVDNRAIKFDESGISSEKIVKALLFDFDQFRGPTPLADDVCIVSLRRIN